MQKLNLIRVCKADNLLISKATCYKWFHTRQHLEIFIKFGGCLFVDLDRLEQVVEASRGRPKGPRSRKSGRIDPEGREA
jgi:hypothetical protein